MIETWPIEDTIFEKREIVGDPKHGSVCWYHSLCGLPGRGPIGKAAGLPQQTCCDREGKGCSGRCLGLASSGELVQSTASKTTPEGSIDQPNTKLDGSTAFAGKPGCPLDCR